MVNYIECRYSITLPYRVTHISYISLPVPDLDGGKVGKCPGPHISRGPYI